MLSIRTKIILAIICMSFLAIALTGFSARALMLQRFDDLITQRASVGFMREITQYYREYGSWKEAAETIPFPSYANQFRRQQGDPNGAPDQNISSGAGDRSLQGFPPPPIEPGGELPPPFPEGAMAPPSGPGVWEAPANPGDSGPPEEFRFRPPEITEREFAGAPAPGFAVADLDGLIWVGTAAARRGESVDLEEIDGLIEIEVDNQVVGYAWPTTRLISSDLEYSYVEALEDSLWISIAIVALLAIPFGILLGSRLAAPIRRVSEAIEAMQPGTIQQQVPVTSNDELGRLSTSFNRMTEELAAAYDELEQSKKRLEELSLEDSLTSLLNRRAFTEAATVTLSQAQRNERPVSLAMIDIDHFKKVNDDFSHMAGDAVLIHLAKLLRENLRKSDVIARYGGEEFVVLLPETELDKALDLVERIRLLVADTNWIEIDPHLRVTMSVGLVELNNESGYSLDKAIRAADLKLYMAKDAGRNRTEA